MSFLFDDFFSGANTIDHLVPFRGQVIPVRMKSVLSLRDREAARAKSMTIKVDAKGNIDPNFDQAAFTIAVLSSMIVSWPFTFRDGSPVPVNSDTLGQLDSTLVDALSAVAMTAVSGPTKEEEADFAPASPAPSEAAAGSEAND